MAAIISFASKIRALLTAAPPQPRSRGRKQPREQLDHERGSGVANRGVSVTAYKRRAELGRSCHPDLVPGLLFAFLVTWVWRRSVRKAPDLPSES